LHAQITHLIVKEQVSPSDIVVLIASAGKATYYAEIKEKPLPHAARWSFEAHRVPDAVLVDTVARFKGLESAIVFIWGLQDLSPDTNREILYVGLSRAKSRLYVVGTEDVCARFLQYQLGTEEPQNISDVSSDLYSISPQ
jgi:superfamily I DNA/RNA helicase